jgi:hypothetical protein
MDKAQEFEPPTLHGGHSAMDPRDYYKIGLEQGLIEGYEQGLQDGVLITLRNFLRHLFRK